MAVNPVMSHTSVHNAAAGSSPAAPEKVQKTEPQTEPRPGAGTGSAPAAAGRFDSYEKASEASAKETAGIYNVDVDEDGNRSIRYEDPEEKSEDTRCTVNTDSVDAEIRKLKEEMQKLSQQLQGETDADRRSEIEKRLQTVDSELQAKDNDTYRKQNAQYTY